MNVDATRRTLLERVKDREDSRSWREFSDLYRLLLVRYASARGLSADEAGKLSEDCMTAIAQYVASPDYDPGHGGFKHWLAALVRRRVQTASRRRGLDSGRAADHEVQGELEPRPDVEFERIWRDEHLRHCLEQLRIEVEFKTFEAFRRLVLDEWPVERVCETYDLTPQYVYAVKSRLTQRLRRLMRGLLGE